MHSFLQFSSSRRKGTDGISLPRQNLSNNICWSWSYYYVFLCLWTSCLCPIVYTAEYHFLSYWGKKQWLWLRVIVQPWIGWPVHSEISVLLPEIIPNCLGMFLFYSHTHHSSNPSCSSHFYLQCFPTKRNHAYYKLYSKYSLFEVLFHFRGMNELNKVLQGWWLLLTLHVTFGNVTTSLLKHHWGVFLPLVPFLFYFCLG